MARKKKKNRTSKNTKNEPSISTNEQKPAARGRQAKPKQNSAKKWLNQNRLMMSSAGVLLLVIGCFIYLGSRTQAGIIGEQTFASLGNTHIQYGERAPLNFNSSPPSSGPHYSNIASWDIYEDPIRYEQLNHNLEDGGVVIYYQCEEACPELVAQLSESVQPYLDDGRRVVMAPNQPGWTVGDIRPLHEDMGARIALTAWTKVLKLDEYDAEIIDDFIRRYEGIDHH